MLAPRDDSFVDAIEILKVEHRKLGQRFAEFFASRSAARRRHLVESICSGLRVHMALEGEIFYPQLLCATKDSLACFVATVNHETVKKLIEDVEQIDADDAVYPQRVYELSQLVAHHVKEAERPGGLFAEAQASPMDRNGVGRALLMRRDELSGGGLWSAATETVPPGPARSRDSLAGLRGFDG